MKETTFERYKKIIRKPLIKHKIKKKETFDKRCDYEQNLVLEVDENDQQVEEHLKGHETTQDKIMRKLKKLEENQEKMSQQIVNMAKRHDQKLKKVLNLEFSSVV